MKEFNASKFCQELVKLRGKETQEVFANKLEMKRSTLSLLENGKQIPNIHQLSKICDLAGHNIDDYFIESKTDSLIYLMGSLKKTDKNSIEKMAERIRIKEKYELLAKRGKYVLD